MAWNDLSIPQRSQLMNLFRRNGVTSLTEMRRLYDLSSPSLEETPSALPFRAAPVYADGGYVPSDSIKNYIKGTEAFRDKWYKDGNGIDTVGYGFTGKKVKELYPNGMTRAQADDYFDNLTNRFANRMIQLTPNADRLSQNQLDALFSYFYNIGEGNYSKGSPKMQQALRDFDLEAVMQNIDAGYYDKKNPGLRKRRDYERALFETDIQYPLQPVVPTSIQEVLYSPEIKGFNTQIPLSNGEEEVISPFLYASGGKIHIKKKNRGKFTALKKRTGHSASWFKAHGTPAQKKMAVFALNARKWKHCHGGFKF